MRKAILESGMDMDTDMECKQHLSHKHTRKHTIMVMIMIVTMKMHEDDDQARVGYSALYVQCHFYCVRDCTVYGTWWGGGKVRSGDSGTPARSMQPCRMQYRLEQATTAPSCTVTRPAGS